jgi:CBS-domain-containing membrane protein
MLKAPQVSIQRDPVVIGPSQTLAGTLANGFDDSFSCPVPLATVRLRGIAALATATTVPQRAMRCHEAESKFRAKSLFFDLALPEAYDIMLKHRVKRLPVTEAGRGLGMISGRDLRVAARLVEVGTGGIPTELRDHLRKIRVRDVMTTPLRTCLKTDTLVEAAKLMRVGDVNSLGILSERGLLVGLVTRSDLLDQLIRVYEPLQQ